MIKIIALLFLALFVASPANAQDYPKPDWPGMVRTLIRFNALDLNDDAIIDEYAAILECDVYTMFHDNEFKWHAIRPAIKESIKQNVGSFPTSLRYDVELQLGQYDFRNKVFRFTDKTVIHNVNSFLVYTVDGSPCGGANIKNIPRAYRAVLDIPVTVPGLPLAQDDAKALLDQMKQNDNVDRIIYARFNMRITYIEPLRKDPSHDDGLTYYQPHSDVKDAARIDTRLESIDFFEDPAMTKLVYQLQP